MKIYTLVNDSCNAGGRIVEMSENKLILQKAMKRKAIKAFEKYSAWGWKFWIIEGGDDTKGEDKIEALESIDPAVTDRILFQKQGDKNWFFDYYIREAELLENEEDAEDLTDA